LIYDLLLNNVTLDCRFQALWAPRAKCKWAVSFW